MNEAALHSGATRKGNRPTWGFCFKFKTPDLKRRVFVNVCGHASIDPPQGHSGQPVDEGFIAVHGIDNLQVPIAVGPVVDDSVDAGATPTTLVSTVDVVVHPSITDECQCVWKTGSVEGLPPVRARIVARMVALAADWVKREAGLAASPGSIKVITDLSHRPAKQNAADTKKKELASAFEALKEMTPEQVAQFLNGETNVPQPPPPDDETAARDKLFTLPKHEAAPKPAAPQRRMVVEVQEPVIKRGFLNRPDGPGLYGAEGTKEGVLPDGAGDPLGYLPKALRTKCKVIDARDGTEAAAALKSQKASDDILEALTKTTARTAPVRTPPQPVPSPQAKTESAAVSATPQPVPRVSNGITIEDVSEDTRPEYVSVQLVNNALHFAFDLTHPDLPPGLTMAQLDIEIEPTYIACRLDGTDRVLFRYGAVAGGEATLVSWGVGGASHRGVLTIDVDETKAKYVKSQRKVTITAPLIGL